jgi:signal-transduction protein with cAMP-binding, CBS, and nucleotidyltransferase domain
MSETATAPPAGIDAASDRLLHESVLFRGCTPADFEELARRCEVQSFAPGQDIIREGDEPRYVYLVREGEVVVLKGGSRLPSEHEMGRLRAGDLSARWRSWTRAPAPPACAR